MNEAAQAALSSGKTQRWSNADNENLRHLKGH